MAEVGIIGLGRFGKLAAQELSKHCEVIAFDKRGKKPEGVKTMPLKEVAGSSVLVLCVPISEMKNAVAEISPFLRKDALVMDVCSVKEYPARIMEENLPKTTGIIATHPLFGPDSFNALERRTIAVCPVRTSKQKLKSAVDFMKKIGLVPITTTAEEHDRQIAESLALVHGIGRAFSSHKPLQIDTLNYKIMLEMSKRVGKDSPQLFKDMKKHNRFAKLAMERFVSAMKKVMDEE